MNEIDRKNIKKIIKSRAISFDEGGDLSVDKLNLLSTGELKDMLKKFETEKHESIVKQIREKVDSIFEKHGTPEDTIIFLDACVQEDDGGRDIFVVDDPFDIIDFQKNTYNQIAIPVGYMAYQESYEDGDNGIAKFRELQEETREILNMIYSDDIMPVDIFFEDDSSVNPCWFGCYGITRDYQLVNFVIRDDGMMLDEDRLNFVKQY